MLYSADSTHACSYADMHLIYNAAAYITLQITTTHYNAQISASQMLLQTASTEHATLGGCQRGRDMYTAVQEESTWRKKW